MIIKVTEKHIREGVQCRATYCPTALALTDVGCQKVCVGIDTVSGYYGDSWFDKKLPKNVIDFILLFDTNRNFVDPIDFEFDFA